MQTKDSFASQTLCDTTRNLFLSNSNSAGIIHPAAKWPVLTSLSQRTISMQHHCGDRTVLQDILWNRADKEFFQGAPFVACNHLQRRKVEHSQWHSQHGLCSHRCICQRRRSDCIAYPRKCWTAFWSPAKWMAGFVAVLETSEFHGKAVRTMWTTMNEALPRLPHSVL